MQIRVSFPLVRLLSLVSLAFIVNSCASMPSSTADKTASTPMTQKKGNNIAGELLEIGEIGSAQEEDRQKRLKFLTRALMEKRGELQRVDGKFDANDQEAALQYEILSNEVLLLEAEKYGLEEGLILPIKNSALEETTLSK
jgi:hypothetical protein